MSTHFCSFSVFATSRAVFPRCKTIIINYRKMNFQTLYNNDNTRSGSNKNLIQHSSGSTDKK